MIVRRAQLVGLTKNLREALKYLSSHADVALLLTQLAERVEMHKDIPEDLNELDLEPADPVNWKEGVEELQGTNEDQLYEMLGFENHAIPFLAEEIDEDTDLGVQLYGDNSEGSITLGAPVAKKPLRLKWHQLVGLVKLMQCALISDTVLQMDSMGMGKTLQILAYFSVLAYYRQFYEQTGRYPGRLWGE